LPLRARFEPKGAWVHEVIGRDGDTYGVDYEAVLNEIGPEFDKL